MKNLICSLAFLLLSFNLYSQAPSYKYVNYMASTDNLSCQGRLLPESIRL